MQDQKPLTPYEKREWLVRGYEGIDLFVDALSDASARGRRLLVVLAVASVLFFVAYWNSRQDSWINNRIAIAQQCIDQRSYNDGPELVASGGDVEQRLQHLNYMSALGLFATGVSPEQREAALKRELEEYLKLRRDNVVLVKVPFFQVVFDINDLGVIAGITFTLLLVGYWFSVSREKDTLIHSFEAGHRIFGHEGYRELYHVLATTQVLNVPRGLREERRRSVSFRPFLRYFKVLLVMPPVLIQWAILMNDQATIRYGSVLDEHKAVLTITIEGILLFFVILATAACVHVSLELTKIWDDKADAKQYGDGRLARCDSGKELAHACCEARSTEVGPGSAGCARGDSASAGVSAAGPVESGDDGAASTESVGTS